MTSLFVAPKQSPTSAGANYSAGRLYFYEAGTSTLATIYLDFARTTAHTNPVVADANGVFEPIWLDPSLTYRVQLKTSSDALVYDIDPYPGSSFTREAVGSILYPQTDEEAAESVTPAAYYYQPGDIRRYDSFDDAVAVCKGPNYELKLDNFAQAITSSLVVDEPVLISGIGRTTSAGAGSAIDNTTSNSAAFVISDGAQRCRFQNFGILHDATGFAAIEVASGAYFQAENVVVNCNGSGKIGILFGSDTEETTAELQAADANSWQGTLNNVRVDDHTTYGVRVNSTGHTWWFTNCSVRSEEDGADAGYFSAPNVHVQGGQWGANNTGGIPIHYYNLRGGELRGGSVNDVKFENIASGEYAIVIDGATQAFERVQLNRVSGNFDTEVAGTLVKFGRAVDCWLNHPVIENPTADGTLAEFSANSIRCGIRCDYAAATAPLTVHASAVGAVKIVESRVPYADLANITTNANLRVIVEGGVTEAPGYKVEHANGAWNLWLVTLADDAASSFTLPAVGAALVRSRTTVTSDRAVTFNGGAVVDADSGGAAIEEQVVGADFNVTTGALAGTTGTDAKVTLSAHTDGKIYLENRSGASADFTVRIEPVIFGT